MCNHVSTGSTKGNVFLGYLTWQRRLDGTGEPEPRLCAARMRTPQTRVTLLRVNNLQTTEAY